MKRAINRVAGYLVLVCGITSLMVGAVYIWENMPAPFGNIFLIVSIASTFIWIETGKAKK